MTTLFQQQSQQELDQSRPHKDRHAGINVGSVERLTSLVGGAGLVGLGLRMRSFSGLLLALAGGAMVQRGATGHCRVYEAMNLNTAEGEPAEPTEYFERGIHVEESVTVNRSPEECFQFWRNFENLPKFTYYLKSVKCHDNNRSHWVARAPAGLSVSWDAQIINEQENELIAWRSLGNAHVDNAGSVRFLPASGDRGTEVKVVVDYIPPAGRFGRAVARIFGRDPQAEIREDLRRFKQIMETGEIPTVEGQSRGSCR